MKTVDKIINEFEKRIEPYSLNEVGKANFRNYFNQYGKEKLLEAIETAISQYLKYDSDGEVIKESVELLLYNLGGILYNNSLSIVESEKVHIRNYCKKHFGYWNDAIAEDLFDQYITSMKECGLDENDQANVLKNRVLKAAYSSRGWSVWRDEIEKQIKEYENSIIPSLVIKQNQSIIPDEMVNNTRGNIVRLSNQINASYENNLFDCCAVLMRRLMEILLILSFQKFEIEDQIIDNKNGFHLSLEKIVGKAKNTSILSISPTTKKTMDKIKDIGNLSAHQIWYTCKKTDLEPLLIEYRTMIEELLYKSGLK